MTTPVSEYCVEDKTITSEKESYLFAFDFDHTVVNENSDCVITSLAKCPVPPEIKKFYDGTNWTEYMNHVFKFLHDQGVTIKDICDLVSKMEATKGIVPLLKSLFDLKSSSTDSSVHILVISDANDLFISEFFRAQVLDSSTLNLNEKSSEQNLPVPFDIITNVTNPSSSTNVIGGLINDNLSSSSLPLQISPYEFQTTCKICPKNLCKGSALQKYIQVKGGFSKVFYTGDGANDVCPALTLNQRDYVFVRKNHAMHKRLMKNEGNLGISANVVIWEDGNEIRKVINEVITINNGV